VKKTTANRDPHIENYRNYFRGNVKDNATTYDFYISIGEKIQQICSISNEQLGEWIIETRWDICQIGRYLVDAIAELRSLQAEYAEQLSRPTKQKRS